VDVTVEQVIDRPRGEVARYATAPENEPVWIGGVKEARMITEPPVRVGTEVARVAGFLDRRIDYALKVVEHEPGRGRPGHAARRARRGGVRADGRPADEGLRRAAGRLARRAGARARLGAACDGRHRGTATQGQEAGRAQGVGEEGRPMSDVVEVVALVVLEVHARSRGHSAIGSQPAASALPVS
jgi:hypothetical protein